MITPRFDRAEPSGKEYKRGYLAGTPAQAKQWVTQYENRMRTRLHRVTSRRKPEALISPSEFVFDNFPESAHENFRSGNWKPFQNPRELINMNYFNAFTFLHIIPGCHRGNNLGFPPNGLLYNLGCVLLNSIRWFFKLPIAGSGRDYAGIEFLLQGTLVLRGLSHLQHCLTRQPFDSESLQQVWDHSRHTQHACLYHMLWEVNSLLDTFFSLISVLFGEVPFFTAVVRTSDDKTETMVLLSPYYVSSESPLEPYYAVERSNILTAYAA
jgi:hypothetical protein